MDMLKEKGRYEEYKRKKAECAKNRRLKNKQNEQYLPPELKLHLMNERRRATRERVKRWRHRKQEASVSTELQPKELSANDAIEKIKIEEVLVFEMWCHC